MSGHVSPIKLYIGIFLTLMVLTAVTIMVAYVNLGPWNKVVALGIASFKATTNLTFNADAVRVASADRAQRSPNWMNGTGGYVSRPGPNELNGRPLPMVTSSARTIRR